jgi:hypothetical protein
VERRAGEWGWGGQQGSHEADVLVWEWLVRFRFFPWLRKASPFESRSLLAAGEEAGLITEAVLLSSAWSLEFGICFCANMGVFEAGIACHMHLWAFY